jgi:lipid-binding SYLF domain-containing protein
MEVVMKSKPVNILLFFSLFLLAGCAKPQGNTPQEKREFVNEMADATLAQLYAKVPVSRSLVKNSVGYGVFSNINTQLMFFGTGNGYGVVTDNANGSKTYMRMGEGGVGLGVAVLDFREVIIFNDQSVYNDFVTEGWSFGGQGNAAAKYEGSGGAAAGEVPLDSAVVVYQITKSGIALRANFSASKYWLDSDLNNY